MTNEEAHKKFLETLSKDELITLITYYELLIQKIRENTPAAK